MGNPEPNNTRIAALEYRVGELTNNLEEVKAALVNSACAPGPQTRAMTEKGSGMTTREHKLKTRPEFFAEVEAGRKTFEARHDDRGFMVGDILVLQEWDPSKGAPFQLTGRKVRKVVSYKLPGGQFGIEAGHCVLGLADA